MSLWLERPLLNHVVRSPSLDSSSPHSSPFTRSSTHCGGPTNYKYGPPALSSLNFFCLDTATKLSCLFSLHMLYTTFYLFMFIWFHECIVSVTAPAHCTLFLAADSAPLVILTGDKDALTRKAKRMAETGDMTNALLRCLAVGRSYLSWVRVGEGEISSLFSICEQRKTDRNYQRGLQWYWEAVTWYYHKPLTTNY